MIVSLCININERLSIGSSYSSTTTFEHQMHKVGVGLFTFHICALLKLITTSFLFRLRELMCVYLRLRSNEWSKISFCCCCGNSNHSWPSLTSSLSARKNSLSTIVTTMIFCHNSCFCFSSLLCLW